jgi:hypothetical protein
MARRTDLDEEEEWDGVLLLEPRELFDDALVGLIHQGGSVVALYSRAKCIELLEKDARDNGPKDEEHYDPETAAIEMYDFNTSGSMGRDFPWFLMDETVEGSNWVVQPADAGVDDWEHHT